MPRLIFAMNLSLDGFIEDRHGSLEWSDPDDSLFRHFTELMKSTGPVLYGRSLYENMSAYWPTADEDPSATELIKEYARIWRDKPKVVFSRTLQTVGWNSRLAHDDLPGEVLRLKAEPGADLTIGGAGLALSCMQHGLIDEYQLYIRPVLLGGGKPMFGPLSGSIPLSLVETRTFPRGAVMLRYQAAR